MKVVLLPLPAVFVALSAANVLADTHADIHVDAHANTHQVAIKSVAAEAKAATKTVAKVAKKNPKKASQEIIVTATRTEKLANKALASVSVLTEQDIERLQPTDMVDLLNHVPGITISSSGSMGATSSLFTRGTNDGHTLILLDGQRISSASLGSTSFQYLDPSQIERIEVVRGGRSSVYGSDAIGGVIQIFTKKGTETPQTQLSTEIGSNAFRKVSAGTRGSINGFRYALTGSYLDVNGIDSKVNDSGTNRDHDNYRSRSINGNMGYKFSNGTDIGASLFETNTRSYYDASGFSSSKDLYADSRIQNIAFHIDSPFTDWWRVKLNTGYSVDESDTYDGVTGNSDGHFRTKRRSVVLQNDFLLTENHLFTIGLDYYKDKLTSSASYLKPDGTSVSNRSNSAAFAEYQGQFGVVDVAVGIREDDNESFGTQTSGNLAVGIQVDDMHRAYVSWSEGFKAPTFNDLYWPSSAFSVGNPNLLPEESENYEIGFSGDYVNWDWSLSFYRNRIDNLIEWAPKPGGFQWTPSNVSQVKIKGAEFIVAGEWQGWTLSASASYTNPRDESTDKVLRKRAKKSFIVDIDKQYQQWHFGLSAKAYSERFTDKTNKNSIGGYALFDARLGYDITNKFKAQFQFNNMFNKHYRTNESPGTFGSSFNEDGANWTLKLTYNL